MVAAPPRIVDSTMPQKLLKYGAVSIVVTPFSLVLLAIFFYWFGWSDQVSNLLAVVISSIPSYYLNRSWVWKKRGEASSMRYEVLPFWLLAILGLALSSVLVAWVDNHYKFFGAVLLANTGGFILLWFVKFLILDRFLFANPEQDSHG